jgi:hypothetical protein
MVTSISLNRITISAGQRIYLHDVSWEEFEQILLELGELMSEARKEFRQWVRAKIAVNS